MFSIQSTVYRVSCTFYNKYLDNSTIQLTYVRVSVRLDHDGPNIITLYVCSCTIPFGPWWNRTWLFFIYVRVPVRLDHDGPNIIILYVCSCTGPFGPWWTEHHYSLCMFVYQFVWTMMDQHDCSVTYVRVQLSPMDHDGPNIIFLLLMYVLIPIPNIKH